MVSSDFYEGEVISTPYGDCTVTSIRPASDICGVTVCCTPTSWQLADYSSSQPRFFMNPSACSHKLLKVGDRVKCAYGGAGRITAVRDLHYVVELFKWKLAQGQSPVLFLMHSAVQVDAAAQKKMMEEAAKEKGWRDLLDQASNSKSEAAKLFAKKDFVGAKNSYLNALTTLNSLGTELPDYLRAEVLEHTIPCHNNVALCCMKSAKYEESICYANNVLMLVNALDEQIYNGRSAVYGGSGDHRQCSMVWVAFKKRGMTYIKLIRDWKKKSLFYMGKASLLAQEYDHAIEFLSQALAVLLTPLEGSVNWALATCDGTIQEVQKLVNNDLYLTTTEAKDSGDIAIRLAGMEKLDEKAEQEKQKQVKELNDLLQQAKTDKKKQEKKEKQTWSRAFSKSAEAETAAEQAAAAEQKAAQEKAEKAALAAAKVAPKAAAPTVDVDKYLQPPTAASKSPSRVSPRTVSASASPKAVPTPEAEEEESEDDDDEDEGVQLPVVGKVSAMGLGLGVVGVGALAFAALSWLRPRK